MESAFSRGKKRSLDKLDLSKKGCIDEDIDHIVCFLNGCESYFTTSSCSGRITLIDGAPESTGVQKQNCVWLFVSHQQCTSDDLISALAKSSGDAVLKFEPFVLHIQCRRLEDAQLMHSVAVNSGFRNSGLTVSKAGRIITAVRSTHGLEVPLSHQGRLLVGPEYIHFLVQVANQKMEENLRRIQRFYQNLQSALCAEQLQKLQIPDTQSSQELQNQDTLQSLAAEDGEEERRFTSRVSAAPNLTAPLSLEESLNATYMNPEDTEMSREEEIEECEDQQKERMMARRIEKQKNRVKQPMESDCEESDSGKERVYLGCLTRDQLVMMSVAVGLVLLLIVITVTAVMVTSTSGSSESLPSFPTGGDMLDFLVQTGDISKADGLLATWYHRANNKSEMNKALASDVMILEADITVEGFGTANQKPVPIMAHPPAIYSDNTLDQWLEAVLNSRKGMKLDFKSLASVAPSLDLMNKKNRSRGISRPVWLNADVLRGPNVPDFLPPVNGTRFLQLIQEKFPDVTVSPGWKVAYAPPLFAETYSRSMVEDMYDMIKDVRQKVTFPVHVLLVRSGWQHISWLLSQSPRFSLTLWQGSVHPNVSDLLFIRDNSHPARVYYDIYEPTLSAFKQAARQQGRLRRFYPGGDLMEYFYPTHDSDINVLSGGARFLSTDTDRGSLAIHWFAITDRDSLSAQLTDGAGGMLVVLVGSHSDRPGVPLVEGSGRTSDPLTLQDLLTVVGSRARGSWGIYLRVQTQELLEASLRLLDSAYSREQLYRPVWLNMDVSHSVSSSSFVSTVERLFPHVTLVLKEERWPPRIQTTVAGLSQRVALHLSAALLPSQGEKLKLLMKMMVHYDLVVEQEGEKGAEKREEDAKRGAEALTALKALVARRTGRTDTRLYVISDQSAATVLRPIINEDGQMAKLGNINQP